MSDLAILWGLSDSLTASCFPPILIEADIFRFVLAPDKNPLNKEELCELNELGDKNFGVEDKPVFLGKMRR